MAVTAARVRVLIAIVLATIVAIVVAAWPSTAYAASGSDGCVSATLCSKLEQAAINYYDIQAKLIASQKRQVEIQKSLQLAELSLLRLRAQVDIIAADRYKTGQFGMLNQFLLKPTSTADMLEGAAINTYLTWRDDQNLRDYRVARDEADKQRTLLAAEVANEKTQLAALDKQVRNAEKALAAVGGVVSAGYNGPIAATAQPAQRNADGSFPRESCSLPDPTGGRCVTPRMVHVINQVRFAGFRRKTIGCWRAQSWGEHPLGRACDFMVVTDGSIATGANRAYGNALAAWAVKNASALGIMYVIWFRQIWLPGVGWRSYTGPSTPHTDHVHISVL